jgi:hypothetical protein
MTTNGIRVPGWLVAALTATVMLLIFGARVGAQIAQNDDRISQLERQNITLDFRLCRIEIALRISPYQSCSNYR